MWRTWNFNRSIAVVILLALSLSIGAAELPKDPAKLKTDEAVDAYFAVLCDSAQTGLRRNYAAAQIIKLGKPALPHVVRLYAGATPDERGYLASILGVMDRTDESEAVLLNDLSKNGLKVHPNVIKALGDLGSAKAVSSLLELLDDAPDDLRPRLLYALGKMADDSATQALWEGVNAQDRLVRLACANGILRLLNRQKQEANDRRTLKSYTSLLSEVFRYCQKGDSQDVRVVFVRGLGELDEPKAVRTLRALLTDNNPVLRAASAGALGRLKAEEAVDDLTRMLLEENVGDRRSALNALAAIGDDSCVPALIDLLENGEAAQRKETTRVLRTLTGQGFGDSAEAWRNWWISRQH